MDIQYRGIFSQILKTRSELSEIFDVLRMSMYHSITRNAKVENQGIPGVIGRFGLGVQNEAGQRLMEFCQKNALVIANTLFQQHKRRLYTWTSSDGQ